MRARASAAPALAASATSTSDFPASATARASSAAPWATVRRCPPPGASPPPGPNVALASARDSTGPPAGRANSPVPPPCPAAAGTRSPRSCLGRPSATRGRWPCRSPRGRPTPARRELIGHRLEGQSHVGAGVTIGHRVDVEAVDELLMGTEPVPKGGDDLAQLRCAERVEDHHFQDANLCDLPGRTPRGSQNVMAAVCEVCGKKPSFGMSISHSHRLGRRSRRSEPNIQRVRAMVDGSPRPMTGLHVVHSLGARWSSHRSGTYRPEPPVALQTRAGPSPRRPSGPRISRLRTRWRPSRSPRTRRTLW